MVVIDIRVGDDNAREIPRRTGMNHSFTSPFGFVGGVCIFWDSSKVFLVPHKFEETHAMFIVKASEQNVLYVHNASVVTPFSFNILHAIIALQTTYPVSDSNITSNCCREFEDDVKWTCA